MTTPLLVESARRLAEVDEYLSFEVGEPVGVGWCAVAAFDDSALRARLDALTERFGGRRDAAGTFLASYLESAVTRSAVAMVVLQRRAPDVSASNLVVHEHEEGYFDRVAFRGGPVAVLDDDPAAGAPGAVTVPDEAGLITWLAERAARTLAGLLVSVHANAPVGRRGVWASVADGVCGTALWSVGLPASDAEQNRAWGVANALLDELVSAGLPLRVRPRRVVVPWSGGTRLCTVRGACCLWYVTPEAAELPDADRYCTSCPLRDEADTVARWGHYLEGQRAAT